MIATTPERSAAKLAWKAAQHASGEKLGEPLSPLSQADTT